MKHNFPFEAKPGIVLIISLFLLFNNTVYGSTMNQRNPEQKFKESVADTLPIKPDTIYKEVDEMPRFPGCENADLNVQEREKCSKEKLLEYVYRHLKYPSESINKGVEGLNVVTFAITSEGEIRDAKIVKSLDPLLDQASLDVINKMVDENLIWSPGIKDDKAVWFQYYFPFRFKL